MNLWLRLLRVLLATRFARHLPMPGGVSVLYFRVMPHDLDLALHLNNGRYLTIMDLGRIDMIARTGLLRALLKHGWTPIASAIKIRFRRELKLFERFRLETRVVYWDDNMVVMEQVFLHAGGARAGHIAAHALFKGGLYDRDEGEFLPIARLMQEIGVTADSPPLTPEVESFLGTDAELKRASADRF